MDPEVAAKILLICWPVAATLSIFGMGVTTIGTLACLTVRRDRRVNR